HVQCSAAWKLLPFPVLRSGRACGARSTALGVPMHLLVGCEACGKDFEGALKARIRRRIADGRGVPVPGRDYRVEASRGGGPGCASARGGSAAVEVSPVLRVLNLRRPPIALLVRVSHPRHVGG